MLLLKDVNNIFTQVKGVKDSSIRFEQVLIDSTIINKKGLFVFVESDENSDKSMKDALYNGAIAAVWPKNKDLPHFLPNHFPVFIVENSLHAIKQLLEHYLKKMEEKRDQNMTKFIVNFQDNHIAHFSTYDKSVASDINNLLTKLTILQNMEGRD